MPYINQTNPIIECDQKRLLKKFNDLNPYRKLQTIVYDQELIHDPRFKVPMLLFLSLATCVRYRVLSGQNFLDLGQLFGSLDYKNSRQLCVDWLTEVESWTILVKSAITQSSIEPTQDSVRAVIDRVIRPVLFPKKYFSKESTRIKEMIDNLDPTYPVGEVLLSCSQELETHIENLRK